MTAGPDATVQDFNARPLTSANWADLEALFSLRGGSVVRGCWCMHYRRTGAAAQAPSQSKAEMRDLVSSGVVPGLVGYLDGTPAGWISLGPRPDYAIGASLVGDHRRPDGAGWVTMADPEGIHFSVT